MKKLSPAMETALRDKLLWELGVTSSHHIQKSTRDALAAHGLFVLVDGYFFFGDGSVIRGRVHVLTPDGLEYLARTATRWSELRSIEWRQQINRAHARALETGA